MMVADLNRKNQEASKIEIKEVISYGCSVCIKIGPDSTCKWQLFLFRHDIPLLHYIYIWTTVQN